MTADRWLHNLFNYQNTSVGNTKRTFSSNIRKAHISKEKHSHTGGNEVIKLSIVLLACLFT